MSRFNLKKGYDLNLDGKPIEEIFEISAPDIVRINPNNYKYIKPKLLLKIDDSVQVGSPLFYDKNNTDTNYTSPCSGKIKNIEYGERRKILSIDIANDKEYTQIELEKHKRLLSLSSIQNLDRESTKIIINESGMWPLIRQRPFSKIADISSNPKSIFIAMNPTYPLAGNQSFILESDNGEGFIEGIDALSNLTDGDINIILSEEQTPSLLNTIDGIKIHYFKGPHPSGNVGVHIHHIDPIASKEDVVWYVSAQNVSKIGKVFLNGKIDNTKIITIGGPGCDSPSYLKIYNGTPVKHIVQERELKIDDNCVLISGDVLSGSYADIDQALNCYDECFTILKNKNERHFLGWLLPGFKNFTLTNTYISRLLGSNNKIDHNMLNGSKRAIIPMGLWEKMLPMDLLPNFLIRSILAQDIEDMERLGIYECSSEDFALCALICQSKIEVSQIIEDGLDLIYEEG